jgi:two-component system nitrate/nitrite response regulator NarL
MFEALPKPLERERKSQMPVRILIADDHETVLDGLRTVFSKAEIEIVAEATTGRDAVRLTLERHPDLVLLDVKMPEGDGLEALQQIRKHRAELPVLMHSYHDNPAFVARSKELGAAGYLIKGASKDELLEAIRCALAGADTWVSGQIERSPMEALRRD